MFLLHLVLPAAIRQLAPTALANWPPLRKSQPLSQATRKPAKKLLPAPRVSTTPTLTAGTKYSSFALFGRQPSLLTFSPTTLTLPGERRALTILEVFLIPVRALPSSKRSARKFSLPFCPLERWRLMYQPASQASLELKAMPAIGGPDIIRPSVTLARIVRLANCNFPRFRL